MGKRRFMGRNNTYHKKLQGYDFKKLYKHERSPEVRIRLLCLAHMQDGRSYQETADMLKLNISTTKRLIRRFAAEGLDGLRNKPGRDRKRKVPENQNDKLKKIVLNMQDKCNGGRVIGKDIQNVMSKEFNAKYTLTTVYNTLHRIGCVWITARSKHPKSSIDEQQDFKKTLNQMLNSVCQQKPMTLKK